MCQEHRKVRQTCTVETKLVTKYSSTNNLKYCSKILYQIVIKTIRSLNYMINSLSANCLIRDGQCRLLKCQLCRPTWLSLVYKCYYHYMLYINCPNWLFLVFMLSGKFSCCFFSSSDTVKKTGRTMSLLCTYVNILVCTFYILV